MSECESNFGVGDTVRSMATGRLGVLTEPISNKTGWWAKWDGGETMWSRTINLELISKADPVTLPGGDDCCNRPLPDFFGEADATEPAPPDGYDRELLEIQLASVHRALSVAHAGLIATPVETVAPTLALGMAMESIESLIRDVRGD